MTCLPANQVDTYTSIEDESRLNVLHPHIVGACGAVEGKTVLDFGCGEGRLAKRLVDAGAREIVCIDNSEQMIKKACYNLRDVTDNIKQVVCGNEECLTSYRGRFDIAICSLVLMMQPSLGAVKLIVKGLIKSLNTTGKLIITLTHPCFHGSKHKTFHTELPDGFKYFSCEEPYKVLIYDAHGRNRAELVDYHRTLSDYFHVVKEAGACLIDIAELPALESGDNERDGDPAYFVMTVAENRCMQKEDAAHCGMLKERV